MNDNEIIKALECCSGGDSACENDCPIKEGCESPILTMEWLIKQALDLINRQKADLKQKDTEIDILIRKKETLRDEIAEQKAEIERLKAEQEMADGYADALEQKAKTEAYKEFAERYEEQIRSYTGIYTDEIGFAISYNAIISAVNFVCDELTERKEDEE